MTTFTQDTNDATYQIRAFQAGMIQINETIFNKSLIIAPHRLIENWPPQLISELTANDLLPLLDMKPDVILIGTGSSLIFPPTAIYAALINAGMGVEIMDTSAACRTYNALSAENRHVVAALIIK